jgi:hypothetical protein
VCSRPGWIEPRTENSAGSPRCRPVWWSGRGSCFLLPTGWRTGTDNFSTCYLVIDACVLGSPMSTAPSSASRGSQRLRHRGRSVLPLPLSGAAGPCPKLRRRRLLGIVPDLVGVDSQRARSEVCLNSAPQADLADPGAMPRARRKRIRPLRFAQSL